MRNTIIYTYDRSSTLYQHLIWDPYNYKRGDQVKFVISDEEISKELEVKPPYKTKNGVKVIESIKEGRIYYAIPETHPYFNISLMLFSIDFLEDLSRNEVTDLNNLFVDTIIK